MQWYARCQWRKERNTRTAWPPLYKHVESSCREKFDTIKYVRSYRGDWKPSILHDKLSCFSSWGLADETRPKLQSCRGEKRWRLPRNWVQQREEPRMTSQKVHSVSTMLRRQKGERQGHRRFALYWGSLSGSLAIAGTELAQKTRTIRAKYMIRVHSPRIQLCRHQAPRTWPIPIDY